MRSHFDHTLLPVVKTQCCWSQSIEQRFHYQSVRRVISQFAPVLSVDGRPYLDGSNLSRFEEDYLPHERGCITLCAATQFGVTRNSKLGSFPNRKLAFPTSHRFSNEWSCIDCNEHSLDQWPLSWQFLFLFFLSTS